MRRNGVLRQRGVNGRDLRVVIGSMAPRAKTCPPYHVSRQRGHGRSDPMCMGSCLLHGDALTPWEAHRGDDPDRPEWPSVKETRLDVTKHTARFFHTPSAPFCASMWIYGGCRVSGIYIRRCGTSYRVLCSKHLAGGDLIHTGTSINNAGQIAAQAFNPNGETRAILLIPRRGVEKAKPHP
jgi:hypothetical protein